MPSTTSSSAGFKQEDFRGCAFNNCFGELGGTSLKKAEIVRSHKKEFQTYIAGLAKDTGEPSTLAPQLAILAEGAQITAAISGNSEPTEQACAAAAVEKPKSSSMLRCHSDKGVARELVEYSTSGIAASGNDPSQESPGGPCKVISHRLQ